MKKYYFLLAAVAFVAGYYSGFGMFIGGAPAQAGEATRSPSSTTYSAGGKSPSTGISRAVASAEIITLSKGNTVVFRAVVSALSVAKAQQELLDRHKSLSSGEPIYIVLDTPGGDINAGNLLIDTALSLGRPVHTITTFAASMGFNIAQRLNKRYITPSGTLMAHRARVEGVGGQVPGEFLTAVGVIYKLVTKMENQNAARLGISSQDYTALVKDEYWVSGEDAVAQNAADRLATIKCDDTLKGSTSETFQTFFGPAKVEWSNCPAISMPISVEFEDKAQNQQELAKFKSNYGLLRKALYSTK